MPHTPLADAAYRRVVEQSRRSNGQFGAHAHSAPELTVTEPTPNQKRLNDLLAVRAGLDAQLSAVQAQIAEQRVSQLWADAPVTADTLRFVTTKDSDGVVFAAEYTGTLRGGNYMPDGAEGAHKEASVDLGGRVSDADFRSDGLYAHLDVSKEGTRARIAALEDEWRTNSRGRSSREIGEDIDIATTRYLAQVAREQGFTAIELDWDQEGREGLTAVAIHTTAGRRNRAGSGVLDDHEVLWAAARYANPTQQMERNETGAPFTLRFDQH